MGSFARLRLVGVQGTQAGLCAYVPMDFSEAAETAVCAYSPWLVLNFVLAKLPSQAYHPGHCAPDFWSPKP